MHDDSETLLCHVDTSIFSVWFFSDRYNDDVAPPILCSSLFSDFSSLQISRIFVLVEFSSDLITSIGGNAAQTQCSVGFLLVTHHSRGQCQESDILMEEATIRTDGPF